MSCWACHKVIRRMAELRVMKSYIWSGGDKMELNNKVAFETKTEYVVIDNRKENLLIESLDSIKALFMSKPIDKFSYVIIT